MEPLSCTVPCDKGPLFRNVEIKRTSSAMINRLDKIDCYTSLTTETKREQLAWYQLSKSDFKNVMNIAEAVYGCLGEE